HSVASIPDILQNTTRSVFTSDYYRPLPFIFYAIIYNYFQDNVFIFHLTQVLFHIANVILILLIFKKYLKLSVIFFLSLVFLLHPINESTVVYIANMQDVLFVFFGLLSLLLLQQNKVNLKNIIFSNIFLLLSLLSKETGILFFIVAFVYLLFFKKTKLLVHTAFSFIVGFVYILMRIHAHIPLQKDPIEPIMTLNFGERMLQVPSIIFYYIKIFIYPKDLILLHTTIIQNIQFHNFFLPLIMDFIACLILVLTAIFIYKKTKKTKLILFSLIWFVVGLLAHLQILPLDYTVADRFFYFPMIGLLLFLGLFFQSIKVSKATEIIFLSLGILLLFFLSIRTMVRNANWQNQETLITHDEKLSHNDYQQELLYGVALGNQNKLDMALIHVKKAITIYPRAWIAWDTFGALYIKKGDILNAKKALNTSISIDSLYFSPYENMAMILWEHDSADKTRAFTTRATALFPYSAKLWYYRFLSDYATKNFDDALLSSKNYYILKRDSESYEIYYRMQKKLPIHFTK
ncbi:MAG: tetratricopeptide repeat protein, partial [Candidatus Levyibacteriota bacterium]